MIFFLIKKSFFDIWDNLFKIVLINLGFLIFLFLAIALPIFFSGSAISISLTMLPGFILLHLYFGTVSPYFYELSNLKTINFNTFKQNFFNTWKPAIILCLLNIIFLITIIVGFPFYLSMGNVVGFIGAVILFWVSICWLLAMQYFFPVCIRMKEPIKLCLKKSLLIALDNPLFSFFILFWSFLLLMLSIVLVFIAPGIGSIMMLQQNALKLRLFKYDWLEEHPENPRSKIPWKALLSDEEEKLGRRTLRGIIFPWRD